MRDPITDAAQDPSCLLCLTPDRGGSWWSRLRPPTQLNFAADPMTFTDSYTAQDGIGTDDFTLSVDFTLLRENVHGTINIGCMQCIYYDSTKGYQPFVRILKSDGTKDALYPVGTSHMLENVASIKVIKTGQNVRMVVHARDGSTVRDQTKPLPDGATVTSSSGVTNYPGNIFAASIRNDTTGAVVWQAAYSDLYDTSNPWPSPVPENFAEKAKAFYDCQAVLREALDPTHDYSFLIDFKLDEAKTSGSVFYATPSAAPFALVWQSNNQIDFFTNLLKPNGAPGSFTSLYAYYQSDVKLQGRHQIECRIEANMLSSYLDGVLVAQKTSNLERTGTAAVGLPNCNSGYVYKIQITDLTDNQVVWSYPSEAERVRLITKTNVRTDRGAFEVADENTIAGVDTQLDLRGNATSKTFIVRAFCPAHDPASGKLYSHPFFGQGATHQSASLYTFQFSLWEDRRSGGTTQLFPTISTGTDTPGANVTGAEIYLDQWHTYAMVIDYNGGNCYIRAFVDGVLLRERTVSGTTVWNTPTATTTQETTVGIRRDPNLSYYAGSLTRISTALIFDRALSAAEIAALTPKQA